MEEDNNVVFLKDMTFMLQIGPDAWQREGKVQPVIISLQIKNVTSIHEAAISDNVGKTLDYGKLYKKIQGSLEDAKFPNLEDLAVHLSQIGDIKGISGEIRLPKAAIRAEGGVILNFGGPYLSQDPRVLRTLRIQGIKCVSIIGVNQHERDRKQIVVVNTTFYDYKNTEEASRANGRKTAALRAIQHIQGVIDNVVAAVEGSAYRTLEALANRICQSLTVEFEIPEVEISVEKPYAIPSIGAAGVRVRRTQEMYQ